MAAPDIERVSRLIEEVAATEVMPRFNRLAPGEIRQKPSGEIVTVADEAVESWLAPRLSDLLPGSCVVGEEAAAANPTLLDRLSEDRPVWLIDPVDGTSNFAEGRAAFAVMVALVRSGEICAGWIHDPINARTAAAARGEGAWLGTQRMAIANAPQAVAEMTGTLLAGFFGSKELGRKVAARRDRVRAIRSLRCAGLEYLRLAAGETHFSLFTKLMPWDHAAGVLLHGEAGGHGAYLDGSPYHPALVNQTGLLLAPDAASWRALHSLLFED
ncbi:MAG: inositol monophosphatase family protein [Dongiaceae bacterium]